MERNIPKPFFELSHSNDLLILDCLGGVSYNIDEPDNPLIDCYFTPISIDYSKSPSKIYRYRDKQFRASVASGYLTYLHTGQCYRKGYLAPLSEWPRQETIVYEIDTTHTDTVADISLADLDLSDLPKIIAWNLYSFAKNTCFKVVNGKLLKTDHPKWHHHHGTLPQDLKVIISDMELIRFYLTNSSTSCKKLFSGAYSGDRITTEVINILHEKPRYIPAENMHRFVYRHGFSKDDGLLLGRILFEPDGIALRAAQRVYNSITADKINYKSGGYGFPKTDIPFKQKTQLVLYGRRIKAQSQYIFLVNQILQCSAKFPFRKLSYCDEISPGNDPAPEDAEEAFPGYNKRHFPVSNNSLDTSLQGFSVSNSQPNAFAQKIIHNLGDRVFSDQKNITEINKKMRPSTHRAAAVIPSHISTLLNASTGDGASSGDAIPQTFNARMLRPSKIAPDLDAFVAALVALKILKPQWQINTIHVGEGMFDTENDVWYSFFPAIPHQTKKSTDLQFSFMDRSQSIRRRLICTEIHVDGTYLYLLEAERKANHACSILLLNRYSFTQALPDDFVNILRLTVIRKTWPRQNEIPDFRRTHTIHGHGLQNTDELADRILSLINRAIS